MDLRNRFPKNAKEFYIEHYKRYRLAQKKKKGSSMIMRLIYNEGARSWLALDPDDKKLITDKYNKLAAPFHTKVAEYLSTAVDYNPLKKKITTRIDKEVPNDVIFDNEVTMESLTDQNNDNDDKEKSNLTTDKEVPNDVICDDEVTMESVTDQNNDNDDKEKSNVDMDGTTDNPASEQFYTSDQAFDCQKISPPEPPKVTNQRELFQLLNSELDETHWKALPQLQKNNYSKALFSLKMDYIQKYETYLRSLSSKDLYRLKCENELRY